MKLEFDEIVLSVRKRDTTIVPNTIDTFMKVKAHYLQEILPSLVYFPLPLRLNKSHS